MAAPALSTPFQPYVYQSPQTAVIPFQIIGEEAQVVQIMLKPNERVVARPGSLCYMSAFIQMESILSPENVGGSILQWLFGRNITATLYLNSGNQNGYVGIGASSLARILPIDLATCGGEIICQSDTFLCSINDVTVTPMVVRRVRVGMFGGEGFLMHKLVGQGLAFLSVCGSIVQKKLAQGEVIVIEAGCVVAMTASVDVQIKLSGPVKRGLFGADGVYTAHVTGPGIVFIQSLPLHRLAQRITRAVTFPGVREPRLFAQIVFFFFVAYVMVVSSLVLTDI